MKKQLPPPSNWQDFEDLCKHIFGEIWNCKYTIKKHGRTGQKQNGVDVYGVPKGEDALYGVQCKGKDVNYGKSLTQNEIDEEISKAISFEPPLKTFVFATTAPKDAEIERYILEKNIQSMKNGGFGILLYDWDDLSDLIRRNKALDNFYSKNQYLDSKHEVKISINSEAKNLILQPRLLRTKIIPSNIDVEKHMSKILDAEKRIMRLMPQPNNINRSWLKLQVEIRNLGSETLENYKLTVRTDDSINLVNDDYYSLGHLKIKTVDIDSDQVRIVHINDNDNSIRYVPKNQDSIVPKDVRYFTFWMLAEPEAESSLISWEFLSRDYNEEGAINIKFEPIYIEKTKREYSSELNPVEEEIKITHLIEKKS